MAKKTAKKKETAEEKKHPLMKIEAPVITKEDVIEPGAVVAIVPDQPIVPIDYKTKLTKAQIDLIKNTIAKGATDDELKMFMYVCERTKLDPFTKQIHLVPRWDSKLGKEVRTPIVGIDGLRSVAERTGSYAGNDDPIFDDENEPKKATVTVYKIVQGVRSPFTATARWDQYVPMAKDKKTGDLYIASPLWKKMPHLMLGKCAEALALRKAFPAVMSGLYVQEEMHQASAALENRPQDMGNFDKARMMIGKIIDPVGLGEFIDKLKGSDKYSASEKDQLEQVVMERVKQLTTPPKEPSKFKKPNVEMADDVIQIEDESEI